MNSFSVSGVIAPPPSNSVSIPRTPAAPDSISFFKISITVLYCSRFLALGVGLAVGVDVGLRPAAGYGLCLWRCLWLRSGSWLHLCCILFSLLALLLAWPWPWFRIAVPLRSHGRLALAAHVPLGVSLGLGFVLGCGVGFGRRVQFCRVHSCVFDLVVDLAVALVPERYYSFAQYCTVSTASYGAVPLQRTSLRRE